MAAMGTHSPLPSRSPSPEYHDRYDPFDPPLDPIEMTNMSPPLMGSYSEEHQRGRSLGEVTFADAPTEYYATTRGGSSERPYSPDPGRSNSRTPTYKTQATGSMFSMGSLMNPFKTMDADAQALVDKRAGEIAQWNVHWQTPAIALALFVAGVLAALGHHFFYNRLDGHPATDQLKMIRYGTALAFFVKSTLVGCIILCYRQRIWRTLRRRAMTLNGIDGLFSATEDPTQLLSNWEMISNGKIATFMAACSWLIPIASVLSPASLTSEVRTSYNGTRCPNIAALNFTHESFYNFRGEGSYPGSSLIFYNTTDVNGTTPGYFDYYDQPSKNANRLTVTAAYLKKPAQFTNASISSCGEGWNCTYSFSFQGPGYKCDEIANSSNPDIPDGTAPFNLSQLAPVGNYLYYSNVDLGDYADPQIDTNDQGMPTQPPPYPEGLGVFYTEPVLWIGYAINTSTAYEPSSPYAPVWKNVHESHIFKCVAHHTNYTYEMDYTNANQTATRTRRDFVAPIIDTTIAPNASSVAEPASNYVGPRTDVESYKLTAAYHGMGALLRNFLRGQISFTKPYYVTKSDISETRLINSTTSYPVTDLMDQIQNVYEEMIITLLSEPHLVVADTQDVPCNKSRTVNVYVYHAEGLWIGYAIAVAVTLLFIFVGASSIWQNGVASDTQFSRILVTTRNPTLDRLSVGACLGGDPFPKELTKTKLRFGVLLEDEVREGPLGRVEHCCFGAVGETKEIVKYGTYAGLKKWRDEDRREEGSDEEKEGLLEKLHGD